ncbi:MAG: hypothetical protein ABIQ93_03860, partial [Saprospiraceae bacterium]
MKTIFTFLLLVSCSAILSAQCNFQRLMDDGRQYFQHGKYDRAIQKYNAARTCNPSQSAAVDKAVDQVFQEIQKQKDREKAAKIDAERQKEEAEKQRKEAVRLGKLADTKAEQANKADSIARKQGLTSKLNAFSNDIKEYDLTFAIQLAQKGCILSNNSDELSVKIRRSIWEKKSNQFYSAVLDGHEGSLSTVKYSSKGRYIATGSFDQYVFLWNNEGAYEDRFWEFESPVMAVAFSPDERFLAVGLFNGQTIIISLISFKQQYILQGQHIGAVTSVAFSPDGSLLLTGGDDKKAFLWDTLGQVRNSLIGHRNVVYGVAFSPDGQTLLTASLDNNLRLWNLRGEQIGQPIKGHANCVFAATFSPNGAYILSGSRDKTVKLWDKTGKLIRTFLGHEGEVTSVAFSPDNRQILSGSRDGTARLWQIYGNESRLLQGHQGQILAVDFAPDGQHFITAGEDRAAKIWDMQTRWIDVQPGHTAAVTGAVFMPDG